MSKTPEKIFNLTTLNDDQLRKIVKICLPDHYESQVSRELVPLHSLGQNALAILTKRLNREPPLKQDEGLISLCGPAKELVENILGANRGLKQNK